MAGYGAASKILRVVVFLAWTILFAILLARDFFVPDVEMKEAEVLQRSREESFAGIYFHNERIGYVKERLTAGQDTPFILKQEAYLLLNILGERHPVDLVVTAGLTDNLFLMNFDFRLTSPLYAMHARGIVDSTLVRFSLTTGQETFTDTIHLASRPFLATHHRAYLLRQDLAPGDRRKVPFFDPISLSGKDSLVEYKGREKILIKGRIENLHHFSELFAGLRINFWLNDEGRVIKEESPSGFIFLAEPEYQATNIDRPSTEILKSVSIPLTGALPGLSAQNSISYEIDLPDPGLQLSGNRQTWDGNMLTVQRESLPKTNSPPCTDPTELLGASPFIQSSHADIISTADSIADGSSNWQTVEKLSRWVFAMVKKRPVIGIPDALTTLRELKGDCNEHATLFAALARSQSIPTRVVAGVTLQGDAFFYHAWNEVCIGDRWISLDTTKNQIPADATHIKFVEGENREMLRIGSLIGTLAIRVAGVKPP